MRKGRQHRRKRRTRGHVIADLSVNHVERYVLRCGFTAEVTRYDYGIDMLLFFYDRDGQIRDGQVFVQLKATDRPRVVRDGTYIAFDVDRRDLDRWLKIAHPVIFIVYDARRDLAYWLYVQAQVGPMKALSPRGKRTVRLLVPIENTLDESAVRLFARYNDDVVRQLDEVIRPHD